jgi:hypothetical protein
MKTFFYSITSFFLISSGVSIAAEEAFIARAVSVTGKVLARGEGGGNVQMTFLKPGDKLYKGSVVNTGSNGAVKLLMTDRTILDLGPSSLFKLNEYELKSVGDRKVDMSLDYGQVRASVNEKISSTKGKFTIRTKAATMGVRGTEFVVNSPMPSMSEAGKVAEPPKMSLTVMHGKVEVADGKSGSGSSPLAVTPGFQFAKVGDTGGKVSEIGTQEAGKIKTEAYQKDMTFSQAVTFDAATSKSEESAKAEARAERAETKAERKDDKAERKDGDKPAPPPSVMSTTMASIGTSVETQAETTPPIVIGDLKLPGTFTPEIIQERPIDQLNGRLINLQVRICPPGGGC